MESFYIFAAQKNRKKMKLHSHEEMLDKVIGKKGTAARNDFESRLKAEIDAYQIGEAAKAKELVHFAEIPEQNSVAFRDGRIQS